MAERDPASIRFEVRVIIESQWATQPFEIAAESATTIPELFKAVQATCVESRRPSILGQQLSAPKFYLQEASFFRPALRMRRHTEATWEDARLYSLWYTRNVLKGYSSNLKVEVHLRTPRAAAEEALSNPRATFIPLKASEHTNKKNHIWKIAPADDEEVGVDRDLETVPGTEAWFPAREFQNNRPEGHRDLTTNSTPGFDERPVTETARKATTTAAVTEAVSSPTKRTATQAFGEEPVAPNKKPLTAENLAELDDSSSDDEPGKWDWLKRPLTASEQEFEDNMEWTESCQLWLPTDEYCRELHRRDLVKKAEKEAQEAEAKKQRDLEIAAAQAKE